MQKPYLRNSKIVFIMIFIISILMVGCANKKTSDIPPSNIQKGVLDLSKWDFKTMGIAELKGEWEFYWNELLTPSDFNDNIPSSKIQYITVPNSWSKQYKTAKGYATYRIKIITTKKINQTLALNIPIIHSNYKLWIDDTLIVENGIVGTSEENSKILKINTFELINPKEEAFYLTIQVSNFVSSMGGITNNLEIADAKTIASDREKRIINHIFLMGLISALALYHLILFSFRKKEKSALMLSFFTIVIGLINVSLYNFGHVLFPDFIFFGPGSKLMSFVICLTFPSFINYLKEIFPEETPSNSLKFVNLSAILNIIVVLIIPVSYLGIFLLYFQISLFFFLVIFSKIILKAIINKREGSGMLLLGLPILAFTAINDVLYNQKIIDTTYLTAWGVALFIVLNTIILARKFSKSFTSIERLSEELILADKIKDKLVEEKTRSLSLLLNNAGEGFLYFGKDLIVKDDYSLECIKIFDKKIEGSFICELIFPDNLAERSKTQDLLSKVYDESLTSNASMSLSKITNEIDINGRIINITFKIIESNTNSTKNQAIMAILTDITEKRELEKQMIQSEKLAALGGLVAGVAHEINTPIGVCVTAISYQVQKVTAMLESFKNNKIVKNDFEKFLSLLSETSNIIFSNLEKVSVLIKDFKRVSVDMTHEEDRNFFIKEQIDSILNTLSPKLKQTKHKISVECDEKLEIRSFPGSFSQIITNLIMNSIIHAYHEQQSGNISIKVEKYSDYIQLIYSDDGRGIPSENIDKIFNPFYTTNRSQGGTGLGLNIVFNIVTQALKGTISCKSVEGEGTSFFIKIPLQKP